MKRQLFLVCLFLFVLYFYYFVRKHACTHAPTHTLTRLYTHAHEHKHPRTSLSSFVVVLTLLWVCIYAFVNLCRLIFSKYAHLHFDVAQLSENDAKDLTDPDAPDTADLSLIKRYDRQTTDRANAKNRTAVNNRDDLSTLSPLSKTDSGSTHTLLSLSHAPVLWPEHTRGAARMIELSVRELRFQLGDFEPFFCQLTLFDVVRKVCTHSNSLLQ